MPVKKSAVAKSAPAKTSPELPPLPAALQQIADDPRVLVRRAGTPIEDGKCVVYWMQRAERGLDNPALDTAIRVANELGLPVVAFFSAISNFPHANLRHYVFLNQGLVDIEEALAERGVGFVVRRPPDNALERFLEEVQAAMVIGDENPCREPERWRSVLAERLRMPYWTVDADVLIPSNSYGKKMYALRIFRPHFQAGIPKYLVKPEHVTPKHSWKHPKNLASYPVREDITKGWKQLDRTVEPVDTFTGGTKAALKLLHAFVQHKLKDYEIQRNHPETDGTSQMSPYLHFGHISPLTICLAVKAAADSGKVPQSAATSYINELIGWRELAVNFVKYTPDYDSYECAEQWAQTTLREHARDKRNPVYTYEQMDKAQTYDDLWNAAQLQMTRYGWMHNYMRMYWAKKVLEWSPTPQKAYENCVAMNDRYFLDGRDPNGYAGVAWSITGKFDRAWGERPIFGKIRFMSGASTGKKFDSKKYIRQIDSGSAKTELFSS
jgi:deoxyribodipyrimidine photo-lyase